MSENAQKGMNSNVKAGTVYKSDTAALHPFRWKRVFNDILSGPTTRMGMLSLADQAIVSATNFLTGVIIGRACSKEELGLYMLGFSIVLIVMTLQNSIISAPYTIYSPRLKNSDHAKYTGSTLIHLLALSAIGILALGTAGTILSFGVGPQNLTPIIWALVVAITFILLREYGRRISFANLQFKTALVLDLFSSVVQIVGLLLLYYFGYLSASRAFWVIATACSIAAIGWIIWRRKVFIFRVKLIIPDFWRNWSFGKWVFAGNMAIMLSVQLYPWLINGYHGTAVTGVFAACWGVIALSNPLVVGIENILGPKIAHASALSVSKLRKIVHKTTIFLSVATGLFSLLILIFGNELIVKIYGKQYAGNGVFLFVLSLSILALTTASPAAYGLWALERSDINCKINLLALCVTLTIGLWFVKFFGPLGAAFGLLLGNTSASAVRFMIFYRLIRPPSTHGIN